MKKVIIAVVAVATIGFAVWRLWPSTGKQAAKLAERPRLCEACGFRFQGTTEPVMVECPKCKKLAGIRVNVFVCRKCGESFEAFHTKPEDPTLTAIDPMKPPPVLLYKREGGEWGKSRKQLGEFKCPKCGSTDVGPSLPKP